MRLSCRQCPAVSARLCLASFRLLPRRYPNPSAPHLRRCYAWPAGESKNANEEETPSSEPIWPTPPLKVTPYTIFNIQRRAAYTAETKVAFYRLAKLYHPDGCKGGETKLLHTEAIERFRLVVAAHEILSDPTKKSAYDRFGAGWDGAESVLGRKEAANGGRRDMEWKRKMYGPDTPFANATWEDWYRWYERQNQKDREETPKPKPRETIIDDKAFFALIFLSFIAFGSVAQLSRVESQRAHLTEEVQRKNSEIRRELGVLRREQMGMKTRDERVQNFLRVRDPESTGATPEDVKETGLQRMLPPAEVRITDAVQKRD